MFKAVLLLAAAFFTAFAAFIARVIVPPLIEGPDVTGAFAT